MSTGARSPSGLEPLLQISKIRIHTNACLQRIPVNIIVIEKAREQLQPQQQCSVATTPLSPPCLLLRPDLRKFRAQLGLCCFYSCIPSFRLISMLDCARPAALYSGEVQDVQTRCINALYGSVQDLTAGTVAGAGQLLVGHPFDTVKVRPMPPDRGTLDSAPRKGKGMCSRRSGGSRSVCRSASQKVMRKH